MDDYLWITLHKISLTTVIVILHKMPYMIGVIVRRVSFSENVALIFYLSFKSSKKKKERKKYHKRDRWRSFSSIVDIFGAICSFEKCCGEEMVKESSRSSIFSKKRKDCRSLLILRKRISPSLEILPEEKEIIRRNKVGTRMGEEVELHGEIETRVSLSSLQFARYSKGIVCQTGNNVATNGYVPFCKLAGQNRAGQI